MHSKWDCNFQVVRWHKRGVETLINEMLIGVEVPERAGEWRRCSSITTSCCCTGECIWWAAAASRHTYTLPYAAGLQAFCFCQKVRIYELKLKRNETKRKEINWEGGLTPRGGLPPRLLRCNGASMVLAMHYNCDSPRGTLSTLQRKSFIIIMVEKLFILFIFNLLLLDAVYDDLYSVDWTVTMVTNIFHEDEENKFFDLFLCKR